MKIKTKRTVQRDIEIDIEFPLYFTRDDNFDGGGWYRGEMRITKPKPNSNRYLVEEVVEHDDHWEFSTKEYDDASLGMYFKEDDFYYRKSSKETYDNHVVRALEALTTYKGS